SGYASAASLSTVAVACRSSTCPVSGIATNAPAAMKRRTTPIVAFGTSKRCWTNGICATHVPTSAPLTKKQTDVAARGVTDATVVLSTNSRSFSVLTGDLDSAHGGVPEGWPVQRGGGAV